MKNVGALGIFMPIAIQTAERVERSPTAYFMPLVVMGPITAILARNLGLMPDPFLMAVALGASCDFLTPIGHQNNMLVMGPGGYRFGDYWRLGLPLSCIVVAIGTPLILFAWPLQ
jgi:di/tricarboxylate transporter